MTFTVHPLKFMSIEKSIVIQFGCCWCVSEFASISRTLLLPFYYMRLPIHVVPLIASSHSETFMCFILTAFYMTWMTDRYGVTEAHSGTNTTRLQSLTAMALSQRKELFYGEDEWGLTVVLSEVNSNTYKKKKKKRKEKCSIPACLVNTLLSFSCHHLTEAVVSFLGLLTKGDRWLAGSLTVAQSLLIILKIISSFFSPSFSFLSFTFVLLTSTTACALSSVSLLPIRKCH